MTENREEIPLGDAIYERLLLDINRHLLAMRALLNGTNLYFKRVDSEDMISEIESFLENGEGKGDDEDE